MLRLNNMIVIIIATQTVVTITILFPTAVTVNLNDEFFSAVHDALNNN